MEDEDVQTGGELDNRGIRDGCSTADIFIHFHPFYPLSSTFNHFHPFAYVSEHHLMLLNTETYDLWYKQGESILYFRDVHKEQENEIDNTS